ncbi:MAG: hypothetical protein NUV57_04995 [archaeon]|nr:hypothetical protein [archaeon]
MLSQNPDTGYFTEDVEGCKILNIDYDVIENGTFTSAIKSSIEKLKEETVKTTGTTEDTSYNKDKIDVPSIGVMAALVTEMKNPKSKLYGMDVVMDIESWVEVPKPSRITLASDETFVNNPSQIGGKSLGPACGTHYVIPIEQFWIFDKDLNDKGCLNSPVTECTISEKKVISVEFLEALQKGNWKITIKNSPMSDEIKEIIMRKGKWEVAPQPGYENFWVFYKSQINPELYLMKDDYLDAFKTAYKKAETFNYKTTTLAEPGEYNTKLKYFWGAENTTNKKLTEVTFKLNNNMTAIDGTINKGATKYADNVLFSIPIDGEINWGTGFNLPIAGKLFYNYKTEAETYKAINKSNANKPFTLKNTYKDTAAGKIITMTPTGFTWMPSDPIMLTASVNKNSEKEKAGVLYLYHTGTATAATVSESLNWLVKTAPSESKTDADTTINDGQYTLGELCKNGGADKRNGIVIDDDSKGLFNFGSIVFQPADSVNTELYNLTISCVKDTATIEAKYVGQDNIQTIGNSNTSITLNNDVMKTKNSERYNLANLYNRIIDTEVCLDIEKDTAAELLWNAKYFYDKIEVK